MALMLTWYGHKHHVENRTSATVTATHCGLVTSVSWKFANESTVMTMGMHLQLVRIANATVTRAGLVKSAPSNCALEMWIVHKVERLQAPVRMTRGVIPMSASVTVTLVSRARNVNSKFAMPRTAASMAKPRGHAPLVSWLLKLQGQVVNAHVTMVLRETRANGSHAQTKLIAMGMGTQHM